jgi:hypothetical protein
MPVSNHLTWHLLSSQTLPMPRWVQFPAPGGSRGAHAYAIILDDANFVQQTRVWQDFKGQWLSDLAHTKHTHGLMW